nr:MAG TPA: hypothetical protein [Caudoviricetes sp.]
MAVKLVSIFYAYTYETRFIISVSDFYLLVV